MEHAAGASSWCDRAEIILERPALRGRTCVASYQFM